MIDKARYIFDRWSNGQELPTIVLRHTTDSENYYDDPNHGYNQEAQFSVQPTQQQSDSFNRSHRSLSQCIVEVHQRAKALFPLRKPCQCSAKVSQSCPPSHSWSPVPNIPTQTSPVLPPDLPFSMNNSGLQTASGAYSPSMSANLVLQTNSRGFSPTMNGSQNMIHGNQTSSNGEGIYYSNTVLPADGPAIPSPPVTLSPTSKMAVVDTLNFELGALQSNSDQNLNWMAFF